MQVDLRGEKGGRACLEPRQHRVTWGRGFLFTFTWSVHQYHVAMMDNPKVIPVQGRSPEIGSRKRCMASALGRWQVALGTILDGTAFK